ncbi:MAG TPA: EpsI family protein [Pirellulaceae bacterium]|nr:EpsI family protein [Pirellulaceae bacterium]
MSFLQRSLIALLLLGASLAVQGGLWWHVQSAGDLQDVAMKRAFVEAVPKELGDWVGDDLPISDIAMYGEDQLKRHYVHRKTGHALTLWLVYSRDGKDRGHHPEICLQVSGMSELARGRGEVQVPGQTAPIHQYLYGRAGHHQWIYYWHYTLKSPRQAGITEVQRLYQQMQRRESSVTLEVFAPENAPDAREQAVAFVQLIDTLMQQELPQPAVRGSQRSPVKRIDED